MAEDKNAILVYADWMDKFEQLDDDEAGRLIKHFFRYVNDLNPVAPDKITKISFIDIENSLKRDLKKWEKTLEGRSKAGKASAISRANKKQQALTNSTSVDCVKKESTNSTDSVNVSVSVNDNVNDIKVKQEAFDFFWNLYDKKVGDKEKVFKKWIKLSTEEKQLINDYIPKYKISQPEKRYRKNPETFLNNKGWNDEIIIENNSKSTFVAPVITDPRLM
tara:strand:- start:22265 stop:22924 length:660 start_codon:yes stop_codon:yes gene_type:complete